jgi:hypothetical protein
MFVVFDTEEKLNSHLINKHKIVDTKKKINDMFFGNDKSKEKKPETKGKKYEFNFSQYIEELKGRMNDFSKNITQRLQEEQTINQYDDSYNDNYYYRGSKNKKRGGYEIHEKYNQGEQYDRKGKTKDIMTELPEYNQGGLWVAEQNQRISNKQPEKETNALDSADVDYGFVFESYYKLLKDYIKTRIGKEKLKENEFIIPKETQYQLIIIIDKLGSQKLAELQSLVNFGIDLDSFKDLKRIVGEGLKEDRELYRILDLLEFKKVLVIYKYFQISWKKIDNKFYKLGKFRNNIDLDQIEESIYNEFVNRDKGKIVDKEIEPIGMEKDNKKFKKYSQNTTGNINLTKGVSKKLNNLFDRVRIDDTKPKERDKPKFKDLIPNTNLPRQDNKLTILLEGKTDQLPQSKKQEDWVKKKKFTKDVYEDEFPKL